MVRCVAAKDGFHRLLTTLESLQEGLALQAGPEHFADDLLHDIFDSQTSLCPSMSMVSWRTSRPNVALNVEACPVANSEGEGWACIVGICQDLHICAQDCPYHTTRFHPQGKELHQPGW